MSAVSKSVKQYSKFDPRYIPGCTLWLDADDSNTITFSSGNSVQTWSDKSVSANNATGATIKPTYPVVISGRNTIAFDSSAGSYMTLDTTKLPTGTSPFSLFIISRVNAGINTSPYLFSWGDISAGATNTFSVLFAQLNSTTYYLGMTITNSTTLSSYDTTNVYNTLSIFSNQATSASDSDFLNGKPFSNPSARSAYNISTSYGVIGAAANPLFTGKLTGNVGEIILFNRSITNTERQQLEGYLAWKWVLQASLPSIPQHPYYTAIGHGPVLSTFIPKDISGCVLWVDASDKSTFTLSGSTVLTLADKSGGVTGITLYGTPTWSSTGLDGQFAAFGTNAGAFVAALTTSLTSFTNTVFIVSSYSSLPTSGNCAVGFATASTGSGVFYRGLDFATSPNRFRTVAFFSTVYATSAVGPASTSTPFVYSSTFTGTTPIISYYNAGSQAGTITSAAPVGNASHCMIGCDAFTFNTGPTAPVSYWSNGQISEVLVFNRVLTDIERFTIDGYLCYKWRFPSVMPVGHIYKKFPPLKIN